MSGINCIKKRSKGKYIPPIKPVETIREKKFRLEKDQILGQLPKIGQKEIIARETTVGHRACLDMLQKGFVDSFEELYHLIAKSRKEAAVAWTEEHQVVPLLENEANKMTILNKYLLRFAQARLDMDADGQFDALLESAQIFLEEGDFKIARYLYDSCLNVCRFCMSNPLEGKANVLHQLGLLHEYRKDYSKALDFLLDAKLLTMGNPDWLTYEKKATLNYEVAVDIHRVALALKATEGNAGQDNSNRLPEIAMDMALEVKSLAMLASAFQELGKTLLLEGRFKTSFGVLMSLKNACLKLQNKFQLCQAFNSLSEVCDHLEQYDMAHNYSILCQKIAKNQDLGEILVKNCIELGFLYIKFNWYPEACVQFYDGYKLANAIEIEKPPPNKLGVEQIEITEHKSEEVEDEEEKAEIVVPEAPSESRLSAALRGAMAKRMESAKRLARDKRASGSKWLSVREAIRRLEKLSKKDKPAINKNTTKTKVKLRDMRPLLDVIFKRGPINTIPKVKESYPTHLEPINTNNTRRRTATMSMQERSGKDETVKSRKVMLEKDGNDDANVGEEDSPADGSEGTTADHDRVYEKVEMSEAERRYEEALKKSKISAETEMTSTTEGSPNYFRVLSGVGKGSIAMPQFVSAFQAQFGRPQLEQILWWRTHRVTFPRYPLVTPKEVQDHQDFIEAFRVRLQIKNPADKVDAP